MTLSPALLERLRREFTLDWNGIHGAPHWARVRLFGLRLSALTGANPRVVEAFAFLHDSQRRNDDFDHLHGHLAALYARSLPRSVLDLDAAELDLLAEACDGHSHGLTEGNITVRTCWDADRLDLGRVAIRPDPARLCTEAARDPGLIRWAYALSIRGGVVET